MNRINIVYFIIKRSISTSEILSGKRNFRKFLLYNKRGTRLFKNERANDPDPEFPIDKRGVRDTGILVNGKYEEIPEKIPEIIVPNLEMCTLKPYVSYKTPDVIQSEFTSQDLFNAVYSSKIVEDFKNNKLSNSGDPIKASAEESLTSEQSYILARKTGSDLF